jgi:hypothetical protein
MSNSNACGDPPRDWWGSQPRPGSGYITSHRQLWPNIYYGPGTDRGDWRSHIDNTYHQQYDGVLPGYGPQPVAQGWECPKCGRVYSPTTMMCFSCGNAESSTSTTLIPFSQTGDIPDMPGTTSTLTVTSKDGEITWTKNAIPPKGETDV